MNPGLPRVAPAPFRPCKRCSTRHPDCAIVGPRILESGWRRCRAVRAAIRTCSRACSAARRCCAACCRASSVSQPQRRGRGRHSRGDTSVVVDWLSGACMLARRERTGRGRRLRRALLPLLGGRRSVPAAARARLSRPLRAGGRGGASRRAFEPHGAGVVDPGVSRQRLPVLRDARRAGRAQPEARLARRAAGGVLPAAARCRWELASPLIGHGSGGRFRSADSRPPGPPRASPIDRHAVRPGDSMPAACTSRGHCARPSRSGNRRTTRQADGASAGCRCRRAAGRRASAAAAAGAPARGSPRPGSGRPRSRPCAPGSRRSGRARRCRAASCVRCTPRPWPCVRQRVDQPVDQAAPRRHQLGVLAAARIDAEALAAEHGRDVVGVQAGGVDDRCGRRCARPASAARCRRAACRAPISGDARQHEGVAFPAHRRVSVRTSASASTMPVFGENSAAWARTCGSRARDERAHRRSAAPRRRWPRPSAASVLERRHLAVVLRDDQLAAAVGTAPVPLAELVEQAGAVDAVARLERAGGVVDAGVNDLAVVRAGAHARAGLALEHADAVAARWRRPAPPPGR